MAAIDERYSAAPGTTRISSISGDDEAQVSIPGSGPMMEVGRRYRNQPAPPWAVYEVLTDPNRDPHRHWLLLPDDEVPPTILESEEPTVVIWSSLWSKRPDARLRFDLPDDGSGGMDLCWSLTVDDPPPDASLLGHMRKRINELINAKLRYRFGQ